MGDADPAAKQKLRSQKSIQLRNERRSQRSSQIEPQTFPEPGDGKEQRSPEATAGVSTDATAQNEMNVTTRNLFAGVQLCLSGLATISEMICIGGGSGRNLEDSAKNSTATVTDINTPEQQKLRSRKSIELRDQRRSKRNSARISTLTIDSPEAKLDNNDRGFVSGNMSSPPFENMNDIEACTPPLDPPVAGMQTLAPRHELQQQLHASQGLTDGRATDGHETLPGGFLCCVIYDKVVVDEKGGQRLFVSG